MCLFNFFFVKISCSFHIQPIKKNTEVIQTMYTFIFCKNFFFLNLTPREVPLLECFTLRIFLALNVDGY